jgi:O-antigen ligase
VLKIIPYRTIYLIGLSLLAISLPLSIFATSVAEIILIANWILEGNFRDKLKLFKQRRSLWLIGSIYLLHIVGLLYSADLDYALHDLRINLPLLVLPIVIGTSRGLDNSELKWVLIGLIAGVTASTFISASILFGIVPYEYHDVREISLFVSHIRLSLLINMAIFILLYFVFGTDFSFSRKIKIVFFVVLLWLTGFIFLLQAITGIVALMVTGFILFWIFIRKVKHLVLRWFLVVMMITVTFLVFSFLTRSVARFYGIEKVDFAALPDKTINGNSYKHDLENKQIENGNYVWLYMCEEELRQGWNVVSEIDYDGRDEVGQRIKYTLIRYLTSRGYRKDSVGISRLNDSDIQLIESGKANYIYGERISLYPKIYEVIWQIDVFRRGENPSGHSITQRLSFLQAGFNIARENFWIGVGTGDVARTFKTYYEESDSQLHEKYRFLAHNQYLTYFVTFGFIGICWFLIALVWPVFLEKKWKDYLFVIFFIIGLMSMMNEDTLETHTGNSYFAFFYALFLLGALGNGKNDAIS